MNTPHAASRCPRPSNVDVKPRRMRFGLDNLKRHWHSNDAFRSHFFNGLSTLFPQGERFFIDSVRGVQHEITDPVLLAEIKGFIAQEAVHGHEHDKYNNLLREQGYDIDKLDRHLGFWTRLGQKLMTRKQQLATTCAVEHFTAIMANALMKYPQDWLGDAPDAMKAIWRWHAIEETEHKAVCFDAYEAVGGSYFTRILMMIQTTIHFSYVTTRHVCHFLAKDGVLFKASTWKSGFQFLWGNPGLIRQIFRDYLDYYRPSFHPWQHDNSTLIDEWKAQHEEKYSIRPAA